MLNFYDFLKVSPSASATDVQVALDALYNQSRRLVTHHDPQIVQQANQTLLTIEEARATLLNPVKRANYDASLNLGSIGGMFDPGAQSPGPEAAFAPPHIMVPPNLPQPGMGSQVIPNGWLCPKCHSTSPVGTKFCKKCGQVLGKDCPKCRNLLEAGAQFCSVCGVNIRDFERELEAQMAEAESKRIAEQRRLAQIEGTLGPIKKSAETASNLMKIGCVMGLCSGFIGIPFWIISIINAQKVLSAGQTYGDTEYRQKASTARLVSGIALGIIGLAIVCYVGSAILQILASTSQR